MARNVAIDRAFQPASKFPPCKITTVLPADYGSAHFQGASLTGALPIAGIKELTNAFALEYPALPALDS